METKKAIEFVEFELSRYRNPDLVMDKEDIKNKSIMEGIISLLQRGKKYKQMWEKFYKEWGEYPIELHNIAEFMGDLEQKYLKEAKE